MQDAFGGHDGSVDDGERAIAAREQSPALAARNAVAILRPPGLSEAARRRGLHRDRLDFFGGPQGMGPEGRILLPRTSSPN